VPLLGNNCKKQAEKIGERFKEKRVLELGRKRVK